MVRRVLESRAARLVFVAVAVLLATVALVRYWSEARDALTDLSMGTLVLALLTVLAAIGASVLAWRRLLADLGSQLPLSPAIRVFALSQLGKYIPGSIWPFVAQVELGREHGVPRKRSAATGLLNLAVTFAVALLVAAVTLPFAAGAEFRPYRWILLAVPVLLAGLHPAILNPLLDRILRIARREPLEHPLTLRGIAATVGWSTVSWTFYGMHVYLLAADVSGSSGPSFFAAVGGFNLAWSVGFLVIVAPAGAGVREVVLAALLASTLDTGEVVVVVLLSRLCMTAGDLTWAGIGVLLGRQHTAADPDELSAARALRRARRGGGPEEAP